MAIGKRKETSSAIVRIGTFGEIVFVENALETVKPTGISQEISANWATHETPGQIEQSEFIAPKARTLKFDVTLSAGLGVMPTNYLEIIRRMVETGEHHKLIRGGKPEGKYEWYIESASEAWNIITRKGKIYSATVSLSFKQYR